MRDIESLSQIDYPKMLSHNVLLPLERSLSMNLEYKTLKESNRTKSNHYYLNYEVTTM